MICCIYMITNLIDGKKYIGQTTNYNKRSKTHFSKLRDNKHHNEHLQRAFNKYGEKNFKIEILSLCDENQLDELEKEYIKKYNCCDERYGYNLMDGGQKYRHFTNEVKEKMSRSGKGRVFSEIHKKRISENNKGRKISKEAIDKANKTKIEKGILQGEKNPVSIISDDKAKEILEYYLSNEISIMQLSKIFSVSYDVANNLIKNKSYKHIIKEKREEIKNKSNNLYKAKLNKAKELYNNNYSQNQIAKLLKISRNTIRKIILN